MFDRFQLLFTHTRHVSNDVTQSQTCAVHSINTAHLPASLLPQTVALAVLYGIVIHATSDHGLKPKYANLHYRFGAFLRRRISRDPELQAACGVNGHVSGSTECEGPPVVQCGTSRLHGQMTTVKQWNMTPRYGMVWYGIVGFNVPLDTL